MRPVAVLATLVVAASAAAQVKTPPKKQPGPVGPIIAGHSSTARAVPATPPAAPATKAPTTVAAAPTKAPATSPAPVPPATKTAPPPVVATKTAPPPVVATKTAPPPVVATKTAPPPVVATKTAPPPVVATKTAPAPPAKAPPVVASAPTKAAPAPGKQGGSADPAAPNAANAATAGGASITIEREVFSYERGSRRDPFTSLLSSEDLRPAIADLRLVGVLLDPRGRNSIAVLHDVTTKEQYRLRPGQTVGRLRVIQIQQRSVTFVIEEFGVSRQQVLSIRDSTRVRTP